jgi:pSer/pThr/pTyr-binding forkhead associated (FHA) protein
MDVEYKKDLKHNYMVISEADYRPIVPYSIKMLEHQTIEGILPVERRRMDNKLLFYYDITAKQSMLNILDKSVLSYDKVKQLCMRILQTIERAYDYLIPEDDFILIPEYIYLDVITSSPCLCFYSGYQKNSKEQMSGLIEYLMNKVDYNDKEAVLLIYQLYAVSREEGFTFDHLMEVLIKQNQTVSKEKELIKGNLDFDNEKSDTNSGKQLSQNQSSNAESIPVMMEKVEGEEEKTCYSMKTLICAGTSIAGGILLIILGITTRIVYNTFGNRIDYSKLFALLLIILCVEGYVLKKILDKKNKVTKIIKVHEYIDPRQNYEHQRSMIVSKANHNEKDFFPEAHENLPLQGTQFANSLEQQKNSVPEVKKVNVSAFHKIQEEDYNPTCILNASEDNKSELILKAFDEMNIKSIKVTSFPFFIGKLKQNVDYCLEKDVVSRYHAKITKEGEQYYVTDLNSTNGTFVNQEALQTYQKKKIEFGDEIALANIKYIFVKQSCEIELDHKIHKQN